MSKAIIRFIILNILLIITLIFSNEIVGNISWKGYRVLKLADEIPTGQQDVTVEFKVETLKIQQDILQTIKISGYAIPYDQSGVLEQDQVKIIFESNSRTYILNTIMQDRFDKHKVELVSKGYGDVKHGFSAKVSSIKMNPGTYTVRLACYQENKLIGIVDTGAVIEKNSSAILVTQSSD